MLSNSADYRYIVNPRPFANGIHGKILPAMDGTAEARVEKYEDYCHLVEALCERIHWEYGYKAEDAIREISFFDPTSVVASRTPIVQSVESVRRLLISFHSQIGYPLVPADWDSKQINYPIYRALGDLPDRYATVAWKSEIDPVAFSSSRADVSRTVDGDTLRRLYRDLDNAKRWMFHINATPITGNYFDSIQDYTERIAGRMRHCIGPVLNNRDASAGSACVIIKGYDRTTTPEESSEPVWPFYRRGLWDGETATGYAVPLDSYLRVYLRSPFHVNPLTSTPYYSAVKVYLGLGVTAPVRIDGEWVALSITGITPYPVGSGLVPVSVVQGKNGIDGRVDIPVDGVIMSRLWQQAHDYCASRWSEIENDYVDVWITDIFLDTGPVEHNTALPSSWNWQPANVT